MEIVIDLSAIPINSPFAFAWWFFKNIGWIFPVFLFIYALFLGWQQHIRNDYRKTRKYILLAIDVPKNLEQGPKTVENIFNQLAGAHQKLGLHENWWTGEIPDSFSFEIISIGGYIQFIVHMESKYRDLIEAIVYAQYPDAEIVEIEDYTSDWNIKFPNEKYDIWGTELKLAKSEYYPIRTYPEFEHVVDGYRDSMAGLLEALTRIGPGEQIWTQIVVTPANNDWGDGSNALINKLSGGKSSGKGTNNNILDYAYKIPNGVWETVSSTIIPPSEGSSSSTKDEPTNLMQYLTSGQKDEISAIEKKVAKLGFHCKIRIIYLAEKEKFNKAKSKIIYGAFKQFNTLDLNSLKPDSKITTGGVVWLKNERLKARKNKILYNYRWRGHWLQPGRLGNYGKILNSEELASLWHFPVLTVKAPLVKKTEAKKAEPPMSLPIEDMSGIVKKEPSTKKESAPPNIPINE